MNTAFTATLGVAALLALPASAAADTSVIVKYQDGAAATSRSAAADRAGVSAVVGSVTATGAQVVQVTGDPAAAAAALSRSSTVEYAEPNVELHALATPDDARFGELYGLNNANDADMDAPEGWDAAGLAPSRRVAASRSGSSTPASTRPTRTWRARPSSARASRCSPTASARAAAPT